MMKSKNIKILLSGMLAMLPAFLMAQSAGVSIYGMSGTNITISATNVYLPPAAYFNNRGNIYLGAGNIIAANTALINGTTGSKLHLLGRIRSIRQQQQ